MLPMEQKEFHIRMSQIYGDNKAFNKIFRFVKRNVPKSCF